MLVHVLINGIVIFPVILKMLLAVFHEVTVVLATLGNGSREFTLIPLEPFPAIRIWLLRNLCASSVQTMLEHSKSSLPIAL